MKKTPVEIQSGLDRIKYAEGLIQQLPSNHDGRNTWLLNYGTGDEALALRKSRGIPFNDDMQAAGTFKTCTRCKQKIVSGEEQDGCRDPDCPCN